MSATVDDAPPWEPPYEVEARRHVELTPASAIPMRPVHWLWRDRLPVGELALLAGREDLGKSIIAYTLAAWITTGTMKGEYHGQPRSVLVAATEDDWARTITPRLTAAGADLDLIYRVDVRGDDGFLSSLDLPRDLLEIEQAAQKVDAALLILDPLTSRLSAALDTHKDAEVRRGLEPLAHLAHQIEMTVLGLIHVNKGVGRDALTSIMGSRAFSAVARAVLFAIKDPEDESRRYLGSQKNNLGQSDLPTFAYQIVREVVAETDEGVIDAGKIEWLGKSDRSISDVLADISDGREAMQATDEAMAWLEDYLTAMDGSKESSIVKSAGKQQGHHDRTLKRAAQKLGVIYSQEGFPRKTIWTLPGRASSLESGPNGPTGPTEGDQGVLEASRASDASRASQANPQDGGLTSAEDPEF
jgi:hypothetical protein